MDTLVTTCSAKLGHYRVLYSIYVYNQGLIDPIQRVDLVENTLLKSHYLPLQLPQACNVMHKYRI